MVDEKEKIEIVAYDGDGTITKVVVSQKRLDEIFFKSFFQGVLDSSTLEGEGLPSTIFNID